MNSNFKFVGVSCDSQGIYCKVLLCVLTLDVKMSTVKAVSLLALLFAVRA